MRMHDYKVFALYTDSNNLTMMGQGAVSAFSIDEATAIARAIFRGAHTITIEE